MTPDFDTDRHLKRIALYWVKYMLCATIIGITSLAWICDFRELKARGSEAPEPYHPVERLIPKIDLATFLSELRTNGDRATLLIDGRDARYYATGHVKNAISLPAEICDAEIKDFVQQIKGQKDIRHIIVYGNRSDPTIETLARRLGKEAPDVSVQFYASGIEQWRSCGLPMEE